MLSTGDLKGSLRKLDSLLRAIKYPREVDYNGLSKGDPSSFLPIVSFTLTSFSPLLAEQLVGAGLELTGKTDLRFTDTVYKVLRDVFQYKPILSKQQFLQWGFSQRKVSVICDIISLALQQHNQLRKSRPRPPVTVSDSRVEALPSRGDSVKDTDWTLPERPLVERHLGGPSPFHREPSYTPLSPSHCPTLGNTQLADAGEEEEGEEDAPIASEVEGRLSALEGQTQSLLSGLERLTTMETRLERLERWRDSDKTVDKTDTITIDRQSWENLLSRVLLLETQLELADTQKEVSLVNGGRRHHVTEEAPPTCYSNDHEPSSGPTPSFPISPGADSPQKGLKDRLERIATMMKETSSLLKSAEPSM